MRLTLALTLIAAVVSGAPVSNTTDAYSTETTTGDISDPNFSSLLNSIDNVLGTIGALVSGGPLKPSEDPFYKPRAGYESLELGEIITWRKVTENIGLIGLIKEDVESVYQLLVRSSDTFGNATAIVTTVLVPYNAQWDKVVTYLPAQDSPDGDCAPSYALYEHSDASTWVTAQIESALFLPLLYDGIVVNVPDYNGPKNAFLAGIQTGHASLDSIRAVAKSQSITGVHPDAKHVLWGYSGGTQPATWGAALHESYAPEVNLVGSAAGGVVVDVLSAAKSDSGGYAMGLIVAGIVGIGNEYPEFRQYFMDNMFPDQVNSFYDASNHCLLGNLIGHLFVPWSKYTPLGNSILDAPIVQNVTDSFFLLKQDFVPKAPVFFYSAKFDEVVPSSNSVDLYNKWCDAGASVEYREDYLSEHVIQAITGAPDALLWIQDRLDGKPQTGCSSSTSITNLDNPGAFSEFEVIVEDLLKSIAGSKVGPL